MAKKVWIDITNSPHVLFFEPLIRELQKEDVEFYITTWEHQQTIDLLKQKGLDFEVVGKHYGKSKIMKGFGLILRFFLLWNKVFLRGFKFSISHGSPYCSIASKFAGIYNFWTLDGDKAKNVISISMPFADKVIIPEIVPIENYEKFGASRKKIVQYPGLKEEVYLWNFKPDKNYLKDIGIETKKKIILIRPEAAEAEYYKGGIDYFIKIIRELSEDYFIILIPRSKEQRETYEREFGESIFIPETALDGPNAIVNCDLIISGGGTMNREAVVLGQKVISTYQGEMLTVDRWLIDNGYMLHNTSPTKEYIDSVIKGNTLKKYEKTDKSFRLFLNLMKERLSL